MPAAFHYKMPPPRASARVPSAAQNETVIQTCKQCGAINGAEARVCCLCDTRLSNTLDAFPIAASAPTPPETEGNLAIDQDWRTEVSRRLEAYRVRNGRPREDRAQPELAFGQPAPIAAATAQVAEPAPISTEARSFESAPANISKRRFRPKRVERLEINVEQSTFDFSAAEENQDGHNPDDASYDSPALSVASLLERRRAGTLDMAFLLSAYAAFILLFRAFGGRFTFSRVDALVTCATLGLLYAQYVTLFTYFAGATPGMMLRGLRVVSLDGLAPSPSQLLWRSFGYLVSAGTVMLGFLWALWDEDQLSWHDRISQTCIAADAALSAEPCAHANFVR